MMPYRPDARTEVARQRRELERLAEAARLEKDIETQANLVRFLIVRIVGYLERVMQVAAQSCVSRSSGGVVHAFSMSFLKRSVNPSSDAVITFMGRFSSTWRTDLEARLSSDEKHQRLNALVGLRNDIAHGKSQSVGIKSAMEYRELVDDIADFVVERLEPPRGSSQHS